MRVVRAGVFAGLSACAVGEAASPSPRAPSRVETRDFASGSRLHARAWDVDGALVLRDFFDADRGEACAFLEDGLWRIGPGPAYYCLPVRMARYDVGLGPFGDKNCTVPVALSPSTGPATYAISRPVDTCAAEPVVHRAAPKVETYFPWIFDGVSCARSSVSVAVQALGDPVPLDAFVRAEERVEERGSRIASLVAVSADGARQTISGFDRVRGEPVRIEDARGGLLRWVPSRVAFQGAGEVLFGDAACASPLPTKIARDAVCPLTAALVFVDQCGATTFHHLGPPLDRARLRDLDESGACVAVNAPGVFAFELGAAIETLSSAFVVEVGGDRVRRRGFAGPGGTAVLWGEIIDGRTMEACAPARAIDGAHRCLPVASATIDLFGDETCTIPAFAEPIASCERGGSPSFVRADGDEGARVFEVSSRAQTLYQPKEDGCRPVTPIVPSRGFTVQELDVSRFPLVEEVR